MSPGIRRLATLALALAALSGCTQYSLVEAKRQPIGDAYTVEARIPWSKASEGKVELWTVDGPALEAVRFFKGLTEGDVLFKPARASGEDPKLPAYRAGMTPNEIMEFVVDSLARSGAGNVRASGLRPARFGALTGFRFELTLFSSEGLELDGLAAGAVIDSRLHLILYTGARAHYFPKYREQVEQLLASIELA